MNVCKDDGGGAVGMEDQVSESYTIANICQRINLSHTRTFQKSSGAGGG